MVRKSASNADARTRLPPLGLATVPVMVQCDGEPSALSNVTDIPRSIANEGRLCKVNEIAAKRREHTSIMNDLQKEKLKLESCKLQKQITALNTSFEKEIGPVRKSYEKLKATKLYWEWKKFSMKEQKEKRGGVLGSFEGIDKYERRREIRNIIDASKPSQQRQRRIKKLKEKAAQEGRTNNDIKVMNKFDAMMNRPFKTFKPKPKVILADKKLKKKRSFRLPPLASVLQNDKGYGNFFASGPTRLVLEKS